MTRSQNKREGEERYSLKREQVVKTKGRDRGSKKEREKEKASYLYYLSIFSILRRVTYCGR